MALRPLHMNVYLMLVFCCLTSTQAYRCSVCAAGKYKSGIDHSLCLDCAENTYSATLGATACVACGVNSRAPRGSSTCACDAGYVKAVGSMHCSGCSDGLVLVNAKCECPSGSSGPSSGPCALCAAGKFKTTVGGAACEDCPMHTYQTQTGARNCTACPGALRAAAGSTSQGMCECGVGFLQRTDNTCEELLPRFVEVSFEIQTTIDALDMARAQAAVANAIKEAVLMEWTNKYNVSREYLIVEVVAIVEPGRVLLTTNVKFEIVVRRIFPVDTSMASVDMVVVAVSNFSANQLEVVLPSRNSSVNYPSSTVTKFEIIGTTTTSSQAIEGTLNLRLNAVVTCTLIPWYDTVGGTSQACDVTCSADQEKGVIAYVNGLYILACVNKRVETSVVQTTPAPAPAPVATDTSAANWIIYSIPIAIVAAVVLVVCICLLRRRQKRQF